MPKRTLVPGNASPPCRDFLVRYFKYRFENGISAATVTSRRVPRGPQRRGRQAGGIRTGPDPNCRSDGQRHGTPDDCSHAIRHGGSGGLGLLALDLHTIAEVPQLAVHLSNRAVIGSRSNSAISIQSRERRQTLC